MKKSKRKIGFKKKKRKRQLLKNTFLILSIYFWLHCVFVAVCGLSLVVASGGYTSSWCTDFLRWLLLRSTGCRHAGFGSCGTRAQQLWFVGLECRLSSCGAWAQLLHGMWDLPRPGIQPMSPALAGGFLTTMPPRKPTFFFFF